MMMILNCQRARNLDMNTLQYATSFRLLKVRQAILNGATIDEVHRSTKIDPWFISNKIFSGI